MFCIVKVVCGNSRFAGCPSLSVGRLYVTEDKLDSGR